MKNRKQSNDNFAEIERCKASPTYFVHTFCSLYDQTTRSWRPFHLWESQRTTLQLVNENQQAIILKARQLGLTWLMVAYGLWMMLFHPGSTILLFSRRDDEAVDLLERLKNIHTRLPRFIQASIGANNNHTLVFKNLGSKAHAFATSKHAGRGYTGNFAIVDEADFIPWLNRLLNAVKPTIDAGGKLVLLSTSDKEHPRSTFKRTWHRAIAGRNTYFPIFLPWSARPDRTDAWYKKQEQDYTQDALWQEYPEEPAQALATPHDQKRFDPKALKRCFINPISPPQEPHTGWRMYNPPEMWRSYLISADPSEGSLGSDPSAAIVWDIDNSEQVCVLKGNWEPAEFARELMSAARLYNSAQICVERNNHGFGVHAVLAESDYPNVYRSPFDDKEGWLTNKKFKELAVDHAAQTFKEYTCILHDEETVEELKNLDARTLKAPPGMHDDLCLAAIIGLAAMHWKSEQGDGTSAVVGQPDIFDDQTF